MLYSPGPGEKGKEPFLTVLMRHWFYHAVTGAFRVVTHLVASVTQASHRNNCLDVLFWSSLSVLYPHNGQLKSSSVRPASDACVLQDKWCTKQRQVTFAQFCLDTSLLSLGETNPHKYPSNTRSLSCSTAVTLSSLSDRWPKGRRKS